MSKKILIDGELAANGKFPLADDGEVRGGYRIVNSMQEMYDIPQDNRKPGMLVCVETSTLSSFYKLNRNGQFESFVLGGASGNMPIFASKEDVPDEFPSEAHDEYLVVTDTTPKYSEEEKFNMILEAMNVLFSDVRKIKKTMFSHMDLGNIADSTLSRTLRALHDTEAVEPIQFGDTGVSMVGDDWKEIEEAEPEPDDYFKISHLSIKSGTESEYVKHGNTLLPMELFWMTDKKRLYIKQFDGTMYWINKTSDGGEEPGPEPELPDMDKLESIGFVAPDKTVYKVTVTNEGDLKIVNQNEAPEPDPSQLVNSGGFAGLSKTLYQPKLYINSIYCGGSDAENPDKYQGCSHNFVELSNLTEADVSLNGLSLQYSINGTVWEILPLEGVIKQGGTYLIRGAKCSVRNVNTTKLKVDSYDLEWYDKNNQLIKFSTTKCKFVLTYGVEPIDDAMPYKQDASATEKAYCKLGYIDMVGMNKNGASAAEAIDGFEQTAFNQLSRENRLYMKYFAMDPVNQATKTIGKRKNSTDWTWVELSKELQPGIENYTPRASFENKTIFYNKTPLDTTPNLINVTFGIDAHKTRCFNWVSKDYNDEYIWIKKSGASDFTKYESFKEGDGRTKYTSKFYNRIRVVATSGECYTAHKFIITDLSAGTYEYKVGREGHESDIRKFKVAAKGTGDFSFVQHSDQQAFNWWEYEPWRMAAEYIRKIENPLFTINTGDHTQNGNRISEWLDYYNAGQSLFTGKDYDGYPSFEGVEQMNVIGNNDLCPENFEELGNGSDLSKINSINFQFFYTYEMDEDNPPVLSSGGVDYYIPSLYSFNYNDVHFIFVNSEIPDKAQELLFGNNDIYAFMKSWCEADLTKNASAKWKVAVCHEMPFTIITNALIKNYLDDPTVSRGGSRLNTETTSENTYWFSQMLEKHGVRLCLGGHKHTYSVSYPIKENIENGVKKTMQPIIQTKDSNFESRLTEQEKKLCKVEVVSKITAPVYAMCQATGAKLTSNKELPAPNTPWLESYFPCTSDGVMDKPNVGQQYPFYIKWSITGTRITGDVVKLDNIMTNGKFNINQPNPNPIAPLNGNGSSNSQIIIEI